MRSFFLSSAGSVRLTSLGQLQCCKRFLCCARLAMLRRHPVLKVDEESCARSVSNLQQKSSVKLKSSLKSVPQTAAAYSKLYHADGTPRRRYNEKHCELCDMSLAVEHWQDHLASKTHRFQLQLQSLLDEGIALRERPDGAKMPPRHVFCRICLNEVGLSAQSKVFQQLWNAHVNGTTHRVALLHQHQKNVSKK